MNQLLNHQQKEQIKNIIDILTKHTVETTALNADSQKLDLSWIDKKSVSVIKQIKTAPIIQLILNHCQIGDNNLDYISLTKFPHLKSLQIQNNNITVAGIQKLIKNQLNSLQQLNISRNNIADQGAYIIFKDFVEIKLLHFGYNNLTSKSIQYMLDCSVKNLKELYLVDRGIGSKGIKLLSKVQMPVLYVLLLQCGFGNQGARHLAKGVWPTLTGLFISNNGVRFDGTESLSQLIFPSLAQLLVGRRDYDNDDKTVYHTNGIQALLLVTYKMGKVDLLYFYIANQCINQHLQKVLGQKEITQQIK